MIELTLVALALERMSGCLTKRAASFFDALVPLVATRLYLRSSTGSEDRRRIFPFARVGPSRAVEFVSSRALAASLGEVGSCCLCPAAGP